jgi:SWI/SNF-related matrix-associated actin-dependent regulator 1 of chromatin subfamily A
VICRASLRLNWRKEILRWQIRKMPVHVVQAGDTFPNITTGWVVINYDIVGRYLDEIRWMSWSLLICDEAHFLKNSKAKRTKYVLGGGRGTDSVAPIPAAQRLLLTGTPIMNRPSELYTLIHYLDPQRWSSFWSYAKRYCGAFSNGYGLQMGQAQNLDELQARLRETIMVRRLKKDVLTELPAKRRQIIALEPDDPDL